MVIDPNRVMTHRLRTALPCEAEQLSVFEDALSADETPVPEQLGRPCFPSQSGIPMLPSAHNLQRTFSQFSLEADHPVWSSSWH